MDDAYLQYREGTSFSVGMFAAFFLIISLLFGLLLYGVVQGIFGGMTGNVVEGGMRSSSSFAFLLGAVCLGILLWQKELAGRVVEELFDFT